VTLSDNNSKVTEAGSVTVAAGSSSALFTATVSSVTSDQTAVITASAGGVTQTFTLNLVAPVQLSALSCTPGTLEAGQSATCTVTLSKAATSAATVALSSSLPLLMVPASVTISVGSASRSFQVSAGRPTSPVDVTLTASLPSSSLQHTLRILSVEAPIITSPLYVATNATAPVWFDITADDPQGLSVTLLVAGAPMGASFDPTTGRFSWVPNVAQAGSYTLTVTATNSAGASSTQAIQIEVLKAKVAILTARNAADLQSTEFCSPGSWASLFGVAFTTRDPIVADTVPLPASLGGVEVRVNDSPVPLLYISESQINFQCPRLLGPMDSAIQVTVKTETGVTTSPISGVMRETTPGLFALNASGTGQGVVLIAGSHEVAMPTTDEIPSRPARRGEFLSIYANGLGEVQEEVPVGSPAPLDHLIRLNNVIRVFLGDIEVPPDFAGLAPGAIGLYQIDVPVTAAIPSGPNVPLRVEVTRGDGSVVTSNEVTVAIE
jgi:uncharacterized protein (TIGR03437 family)